MSDLSLNFTISEILMSSKKRCTVYSISAYKQGKYLQNSQFTDSVNRYFHLFFLQWLCYFACSFIMQKIDSAQETGILWNKKISFLCFIVEAKLDQSNENFYKICLLWYLTVKCHDFKEKYLGMFFLLRIKYTFILVILFRTLMWNVSLNMFLIKLSFSN